MRRGRRRRRRRSGFSNGRSMLVLNADRLHFSPQSNWICFEGWIGTLVSSLPDVDRFDRVISKRCQILEMPVKLSTISALVAKERGMRY
jgi:hypothetical protein